MKKILLLAMVLYSGVLFSVQRSLIPDFEQVPYQKNALSLDPNLSKGDLLYELKYRLVELEFSDFFIGLIFDSRALGSIMDLHRNSFDSAAYLAQFEKCTAPQVKNSLEQMKAYIETKFSPDSYLGKGHEKELQQIERRIEKLSLNVALLLRYLE